MILDEKQVSKLNALVDKSRDVDVTWKIIHRRLCQPANLYLAVSTMLDPNYKGHWWAWKLLGNFRILTMNEIDKKLKVFQLSHQPIEGIVQVQETIISGLLLTRDFGYFEVAIEVKKVPDFTLPTRK